MRFYFICQEVSSEFFRSLLVLLGHKQNILM
jgi:hypothetical protein